MAKYIDALNSRLEVLLSQENKITEILGKLEKATSVRKIRFAQGIIGFFALYMILGHFAQLICNAVGFIYPAYCSIHALESSSKDDDTKWLTYWVVYSAFSMVEFFSDFIFSWFPFYWLAKIIFLVWSFSPITNGSMVIYSRFIRPVFLRNHAAIDKSIDKAGDAAAQAASRLLSKDE